MSRANNKQSLADLVSQLSIFSKKDEYDGIVNTAKKILIQKPSDKQALQALITAYVDHDKYDNLYELLSNDPQKNDYLLYYGYSLYKLDLHDELVDLLGDSQQRGAMHLLAQSYYKQGLFTEARAIYKKFVNTPDQVDHETFDLSVNERAIISQLKFVGLSSEPPLFPATSPESYDQLFNDALISIASQDYTQALELLTRAKAICQTTPGFSPEALAAEITPILIQASYVNIKLSQYEQAASILDSIDYENFKDNTSLYLINTLRLVIDGGKKYKNPHSALSLLDFGIPYPEFTSHLVPLQKRILTNNKFLLELAGGKSRKNLLNRRNFTVDKSIEAYSFYKDVKDLPRAEQIKRLKKTRHSNNSNPALCFTIAQIYVFEKEYSLAAATISEFISYLEQFYNFREAYTPAVLSSFISLCSLAGKTGGHLVTVLESAIKYWSKEPEALKNPAFQSLFADAAIVLSGTGKEALVKEKLEEIYKKDPSNNTVVAGLFGLSDENISTQLASESAKLVSIADATAGINVDSLSLSGLEPLIKKRSAPESGKSAFSEPKRKNKKPRLPKDYDADKTPDPERWIPLRDRSTYKPPKNKGKKKVLASTQGGQADESLAVTSGTSTQSSSGTVATSKSKPKNAKKSKKKGRK